jgi:hypothetical protein
MSMKAGDTSALSSVATNTANAVDDIKSAAAGATSPNPAVRTSFLQDLQNLSDAVNNPPTDPSGFIGNQDVMKIEADARGVGCNVG